MADSNEVSKPEREHLFKILVIGDLGTGKTSFIKRYVHQTFSAHYRATIGVDFALKVLNWDSHTVVRLQLWDIAGQERFGQMTRVYYKEAIGCFIVYDVTRRSTFDSAVKWKEDLDSKVRLPDGRKIPCVLLGNKCDELEKEGKGCNDKDMDAFCRQHSFGGWYEVSALNNLHVDDSAHFLVEEVLKATANLHTADIDRPGGGIVLEPPNSAESSTRKCC